MANPLTGEFQAVLQVNEATINRLLATIFVYGLSSTWRMSRSWRAPCCLA